MPDRERNPIEWPAVIMILGVALIISLCVLGLEGKAPWQ